MTVSQWLDDDARVVAYLRHNKGNRDIRTIQLEKRADFYTGRAMVLATYHERDTPPFSRWYTPDAIRVIYGRRQARTEGEGQ